MSTEIQLHFTPAAGDPEFKGPTVETHETYKGALARFWTLANAGRVTDAAIVDGDRRDPLKSSACGCHSGSHCDVAHLPEACECHQCRVAGGRLGPLYGHTSEATAFLVGDYPYGRTVRCRIRYWLEADKKKGYRFVSQTEEPRTKRWNKPKRSTYALVAANMYLDEKGHVQWSVVTEYSSAEESLRFAQTFPRSDSRLSLYAWAKAKAAHCEACRTGKRFITINGEPRPWSEADIERFAVEVEVWKTVAELTRPAPKAAGGAS